MLKANNQLSFCLSSHASLFDVLIEKDNFWRQLKDMVDFSFVYDELKNKYSSTILLMLVGKQVSQSKGQVHSF